MNPSDLTDSEDVGDSGMHSELSMEAVKNRIKMFYL